MTPACADKVQFDFLPGVELAPVFDRVNQQLAKRHCRVIAFILIQVRWQFTKETDQPPGDVQFAAGPDRDPVRFVRKDFDIVCFHPQRLGVRQRIRQLRPWKTVCLGSRMHVRGSIPRRGPAGFPPS